MPAPRDLNTHHLFTPAATLDAWEARGEALRGQILFSAGLCPLPEKTPLNPRVTGTIEGADYVIENVAIETYPGFYVCGNLFRPKGKAAPFPAVLHAHGHWANGRLQIDEDVPKADPAPAKMGKGRGNLPAIGINLARQGFVVFAWDMVGYNDTNQIPQHREFCKDLRPWLWNVSLLGLQLWNSVRVMDYVTSLPDVDKKRIGMTGASGGGTQTFLLTAVDERVKVAVPVNMVSAHMQGGCLCENAPGLRVGTDNAEIAALTAPRPLLLVAATGDWTKNNPKEEWPAIKKVYDLFDKGDRTAVQQFNYEHNYNIESREAMYAWFGRWLLKDKDPEHFRERPISVDPKALRVWNEQNPRPANALKDTELIQLLIGAAEKRLTAMWPTDKKGLKRFKKELAPELALSLAVDTNGERVIVPDGPGSPSQAAERQSARSVVLVAGKGQEARAERLAGVLGKSDRSVRTLVLDAPPPAPAKLLDNFFTCYNRTPLGADVQRILDALENCRRHKAKEIALVALGDAGPKALLARALFAEEVSAVVDTAGFANTDDQAYLKALCAPGLRRAGDVRAAAVLGAPAPLCLFNTGTAFQTETIAGGYRAVGGKLRVEEGDLSDDDIVNWVKG
ncbi:MAG: acetylxylan esterase [Planctomycetota bacterium]|nr:acetylxylan esterase [Planctomycetota bacterium]